MGAERDTLIEELLETEATLVDVDVVCPGRIHKLGRSDADLNRALRTRRIFHG